MTAAPRDHDAMPPSDRTSTEEGFERGEASARAVRAAADEAAAAARRNDLRSEPLPTVDPDDLVANELETGEVVHDLRERAILRAPGDDRALGYGGSLYLTSRRLVHIGQVIVSMKLSDILETSLAGERLLLTLRGGDGVSLDLDEPRQFRVCLAWATRQARA